MWQTDQTFKCCSGSPLTILQTCNIPSFSHVSNDFEQHFDINNLTFITICLYDFFTLCLVDEPKCGAIMDKKFLLNSTETMCRKSLALEDEMKLWKQYCSDYGFCLPCNVTKAEADNFDGFENIKFASILAVIPVPSCGLLLIHVGLN